MTGHIAFIDILGYQSFLKNNSATESALNVLELVTRLPSEVCQKHAGFWSKFLAEREPSKAVLAKPEVKHLIFSDTIVLLSEVDIEADEQYKQEAFTFFSMLIMDLTGHLFTQGLPARCALHEGEFVYKDTCLAGKGIVEAYELCNRLDFSGAVLSPQLAKWVLESKIIADHAAEIAFVDYLAPMKDGKEERLTCLNWFMFTAKTDRLTCKADVIQYVMNSFWAHRKDAPLAADSKIRNTCKLLRKFISMLDSHQNKQHNKEVNKIKES